MLVKVYNRFTKWSKMFGSQDRRSVMTLGKPPSFSDISFLTYSKHQIFLLSEH